MSANTEEHRHFSRINFDAKAVISQSSHQWLTKLLDISLKGALVEKPADWQANEDETFVLQIELSEDATIRMEATVAHIESNHIGFRCDHIDLDSITHLRRIVELNTGSEELLHRELSALNSN